MPANANWGILIINPHNSFLYPRRATTSPMVPRRTTPIIYGRNRLVANRRQAPVLPPGVALSSATYESPPARNHHELHAAFAAAHTKTRGSPPARRATSPVHADFAGMVLDPPAKTAPLRARRWRSTAFWLLLLVFLISVTGALFFLR
jgi:hypothetical protein